MVLQEAGNTEQALDHLDTYQHQICDKVTLLETRAKYYMQIQKTTDSEESKKLQTKAADIYKGLIKRNPENHAYYTKLAESMDVKTEESQLAMYAEYRKMFPKAQAPQRLPMNFAQGKWVKRRITIWDPSPVILHNLNKCHMTYRITIYFANISGESFRELVDAYLKKALRKGIPPLFVDLRPLYKDPANVVIIEELCLNYATSLKSDDCSFDVGGAREPATALLWVYYYLAQHYDYKKEYDKAFEMVNAAIEHTPTLIELFLLKGKLYKVKYYRSSAANNFTLELKDNNLFY